MIIDSHGHLGTLGRYQANASDLIRWLDRAGIDMIVVSHLDAIFYDARLGNDDLGAAIQTYPDRIAGYMSFPSAYAGQAVIDEMDRCVEMYDMRGVKIYSHLELPEKFSVAEPAMVPIIEHAAELRLPILAHANASEVEYLAQRVPEATILIAHLGEQVSANMWQTFEVARAFPNVVIDLTCSQIYAGMVEACVAAAGPERVVFGTDLPLLEPEVQIQKVFAADIDGRTRELILGGNAARLFRLETASEVSA